MEKIREYPNKKPPIFPVAVPVFKYLSISPYLGIFGNPFIEIESKFLALVDSKQLHFFKGEERARLLLMGFNPDSGKILINSFRDLKARPLEIWYYENDPPDDYIVNDKLEKHGIDIEGFSFSRDVLHPQVNIEEYVGWFWKDYEEWKNVESSRNVSELSPLEKTRLALTLSWKFISLFTVLQITEHRKHPVWMIEFFDILEMHFNYPIGALDARDIKLKIFMGKEKSLDNICFSQIGFDIVNKERALSKGGIVGLIEILDYFVQFYLGEISRKDFLKEIKKYLLRVIE